jgi:Flp pilus assembly protein TadD
MTIPSAGMRPLLALMMSASLAACAASDATISGSPSLDTARVALTSGSADLALNICTNLLAKRPRDGALLVCRADALVSMGRNAEAIGLYQSALELDGRLAIAKLGLGRIYLGSDPARAEALFLDALTSDARNAQVLNNLGIARDLQGRHAEAQMAYGEAIAAAPDLRAPQVNLALSMAMTGRAGEAVRIMRPIGERSDATQRERHDLAAVLAMDGKTDEAARLLRTDLDGSQADEAVTGFQSLPGH